MILLFLLLIGILIAVFVFVFVIGLDSREAERLRNMPIAEVNLAVVADGSHRGTFTCRGFTYEVETTVRNGRIERVDILRNRNSRSAQTAAGIAGRIVERQSPNVEVFPGAAITSKALMKAVEKSLTVRNESASPE